ncbi:MAG: hypothetical protein IPJ27_00355 [Candidatus Accumulibacter sp.]|uniref:Uncharacterized protein n=1 Tax=Candidatus Accumulibacter proximus TaxID=2954385 RepID=A0A935UDX0_9PROT|nr:hypothetical protein [Candidatus Accumulibacter proximus]
MKVLANLLFFVTLYLVYLVHERESAPTVALLVAASVIGVVGKIVQLKGRSCLTAYRDARARLIYERIANGEQVNGDTFLYLRPFHSTMNLTVSNPRAQSSGTLESLAEDRVVELESVLRTSLDPFGTLVGLGLPGESEGAGRILTTEENWRAAFQKLAEAARLLILLPSSRPGTLEEIIYLLRNGLLGKTLFIMPSNTMSAYDAKNEWTKTANTLSELGLHLPAYSAEGRILAFRANGEIFDSPMELSSKARLTPAISAAASWLGSRCVAAPCRSRRTTRPCRRLWRSRSISC